jgi:hypothetical protein
LFLPPPTAASAQKQPRFPNECAIEVTKAQTKTEEPLLGSVSQMANKVAKMQVASQNGPLVHLRLYISVALLSLLHSLGFNPEEEEE